MSFTDLINGGLSFSENFELFLRLIVACICGILIGGERSRSFKDAGVRMHIIVCCGAALIMVVSKYGFVDMVATDDTYYYIATRIDPARIAAQVVSGLSFLGAGIIFRREGLVRGLSTAAGIWLTGAIGLAVGSGLVGIGVCATLLILTIQLVMNHFTLGADSYSACVLEFTVKNGQHFFETLLQQLKEWDATVVESSYDRDDNEGTTTYNLLVRRKAPISYEEMREFVEKHPEVIRSKDANAHR